MKTTLSLLVGATLALPPWAADAHAFIDQTAPRIGAVVDRSPPAVVLRFTQAVEEAASAIEVRNEAGARIDRRDTRRDPADPKVLSVSLPALPEGDYRVAWHAVAADSHKTEGLFLFTVRHEGAVAARPPPRHRPWVLGSAW